MKILLDENIPHQFRSHLGGDHEVFTVQWLGWSSIKNGKLLSRADGQYDVLVTVDKGIIYQNNFTDKSIAVITMISASNRMADLKVFIPILLNKLNHIKAGQVINISKKDI